MTKNSEILDRYLIFKLDNVLFSFPLNIIEEIINVPEITKVPLTPQFVKGIANIRGEIISIMDLKSKIKNDSTEIDENSRIIIVNNEGSKTGFLIDSVVEVHNAKSKEIDTSNTIDGIDNNFLKGILRLSRNKMVPILFPTNIIGDFSIDDLVSQQQKREIIQNTTEIQKVIDDRYDKILIFQLDDQKYAIEIKYIKEAIRLPEITPISGSAETVIGVFELREKVIQAIDLKYIVSTTKTTLNELLSSDDAEEVEEKIIVFQKGGVMVGFVVDNVHEVISPLKAKLAPPPETFKDNMRKMIKFIYRNKKNDLIFILDENNLVDSEIHSQNANNENDATDMEKNIIDEKTIVICQLANQEYGFYIDDIYEINNLPEITKLPNVSKFVEGIINLRGEIVPVINLRERLNLPRIEFDDATKVVIVEMDRQKTALIADSIKEIKSIPLKYIRDVPPIIATNLERNFLDAVVDFVNDQRMINIISVKSLLSNLEKGIIKEIANEHKKKKKSRKSNQNSAQDAEAKKQLIEKNGQTDMTTAATDEKKVASKKKTTTKGKKKSLKKAT